MVKPTDYFVGMIDFFSVFLPGGMFTFVTYSKYKSFFFGVVPLEGSQVWIGFLFFSYLLGHIIYMIGARLDPLYEKHRRSRNPYTNELAFQRASDIKHKFLSGNESGSVNTFQWSTSVLTTSYPDAMNEINRLVADQKFFRSLVVAVPLISLILIFNSDNLQAVVFFALIIPCYIRYYERRLKSTKRAYQYVIMLEGLGKLVPPKSTNG